MNTVLILDDDDNYRELVQLTLEDECGVGQVLGFADGSGLLQHVSDGGTPPDLILLDLHIEDMDGREVFRRLRLQGVRAPVAFLSGAAQAAERERCMADGAVAFLPKPAEYLDLARQLQELLASPRVKQNRAP